MKDIAKTFFATVQNKLHFAIHGHTAAELIELRSDASKDNMGLTTWKGVKVRKADVTVAENYLTEKELKALNRIVTMYLDYAEDQAERRNPMYMKDWEEKLNAFLKFNDREILTDAGTVSHEVGKELALKEYEKFNQRRLEKPEKDDFDVYLEEQEWIDKK
ncbi:RhuM family protein [Acetobacterium fimetarium]|uniref:RhuM family protein n=1 Tax=Acetobacterium fimetarium TaxID=52691 RepID=UPI001FAB83C5|nr:RhuM family protein [Acetobacterium fimetarium]